MNISHDSATLPGKIVSASAELIAIDGRRLVFSVSARDEYGPIGQGIHERFIINNEKFLAKLKKQIVKTVLPFGQHRFLIFILRYFLKSF